jgi:serine/threonine-protein kinase
VLPKQDAIAFATGSSSNTFAMRLGIFMRKSHEVKRFDIPLTMPLGLVDDRLVYVSPTGALMALRLDRSYTPVGDPIQLDENVLVDPTAGVKASLSRSGTLAYIKGRAQFQLTLLKGAIDSGIPLLREVGSYSSPRFSPDGGRIALTTSSLNATDIYVYDVARHTFTRITTEGFNQRPEWTPDGKSVIFISSRNGKVGIMKQPIDGSGPAELLASPEYEPFEALLSPDEKWIVYRTAPGSKYPRDILAIPLSDTKKFIPLVTGPYTESMPRLSPDGKWLTYQSNETGRFEIYMRPFPNNGAHTQISDNGGTEALWGRDGHSLYYRGPNNEIIKVEVNTAGSISLGKHSVILTGDYLTDSSHPNWDIAPDGHFLMLKRTGPESQTIVVHNWATELRAKLAKK